MSSDQPLVNRVANSGLITLNLEEFFPAEEVMAFDLMDYLFLVLILMEKDFRLSLQSHDWTQYEGKNLAVFCSTDAIIPVWAYMLVAAYASPHVVQIFQGTPETFYQVAFQMALTQINGADYEQKRVVIKGCSNKPVPPSAYVELTRRLRPYAQSIMSGEPCSPVPIFNRPRVLRRKS